jgi:hypothetical protein
MGRLDHKTGRFDADFETNEIYETLRGYEGEWGDKVTYYRFWREESRTDDIWGEPGGSGRSFHEPVEIPVLHATHVEGSIETRPEGAYYNDSLYVTASYDVLSDLGFNDIDIQHYGYQRDRIVYDWRVFQVTRIQVTGQIARRDMVVAFEGSQIKPDEMVNDPQFREFANQRFGPA